MAVPSDWITHRRGDGELLGWMRPDGDGFVAIDLLGRDVTAIVDWLEAEETLEETGIGYLADPYELLVDGEWVRVRLTEVSADAIRVKTEDWGAIDAPVSQYVIPLPAPDTLRPHRSR
jgi:hypothetical protein